MQCAYMRLIGTNWYKCRTMDYLSVCLSVCLSVSVCCSWALQKNGWTDRDAVWNNDMRGVNQLCITLW